MLRFELPVGLLLLGCLGVQGAAAGAADDQALQQKAAAVAPVLKSLDARKLAIEETVLDYCATKDPRDAAKVRAQLIRLVHGASKETLAAARQSAEYQRARDSEVDFIGKVQAGNAHRLCSRALSAGD